MMPTTTHADVAARNEREKGAAMLIAILVVTVVAVLSASVAVVAMRSTTASGSSRTAVVVKDLANAGLASGVTYLREIGANPAIDSEPNTFVDPEDACESHEDASATPSWTRSSPAQIGAGGQASYIVWIERVAAGDASQGTPATYRVCAEGESGKGLRKASAEVQYTPAGGGAGPYAVYGKGYVSLQSNAQEVRNMSVYSEKCIDRKHNQTTFNDTDFATGLPAAAHSMQWVLGKNGNPGCIAADSLHAGTAPARFVHTQWPYDTDQAGGTPLPAQLTAYPFLSGLPWGGSTLEPAGQSAAEFRAKWNVPDMLSPTSIDALEQEAKRQGNYYKLPPTNVSSIASPDAADQHAVVFLDMNGGSVDLKDMDFAGPTFTSEASCPTGRSLIIVVRNGDVTAHGGGGIKMRASVIVANGKATVNSNFTLIGGLFVEKELSISGNFTTTLDTCAINNPPPGGTPNVVVTNEYREYDGS